MEAGGMYGSKVAEAKTPVAKIILYEREHPTIKGRKLAVLHIELMRPVKPGEIEEVAKTARQLIDKHYFARTYEVKTLVISGRMPIWLYAALVHEFMHTFASIATYDPKVGAVVIASHTDQLNVGDIIPL